MKDNKVFEYSSDGDDESSQYDSLEDTNIKQLLNNIQVSSVCVTITNPRKYKLEIFLHPLKTRM